MTPSTKFPVPTNESMSLAQSYQQSMQGLNAVVAATPSEAGVVMLKPGQLTTVNMQAGQHYKLRKIGNDGVTLQTPDNVIAVRHGDALHVRYADGSNASFDNFYSTCTSGAECSVNLANDVSEGVTLSAADAGGAVADDGLLVYAHGEHDVLMGMAQDQSSLLSTLRGLGNESFLTYLPGVAFPGALAMAGLGALGFASAASSVASGSAAALSAGSVIAAASPASLNTISTAAENNSAASSHIGVSDYEAAKVTGVTTTNLASINSALDSAAVNGAKADTTAEVQAIVDAYQTILTYAGGVAGNALQSAPTANQYALIGVTGVFGTPARDQGIFLLNNAVDIKATAGVDTTAEVQAIANAANHVIDAAGGTAGQIAALTQADLAVLGVTGVTTDNLAAVLTVIGATASDNAVKTVALIQDLVNEVINAGTPTNALNQIRDAAQNNTATDIAPGVGVYAVAGVTGVNSVNLASFNSALDSVAVTGVQADTTGEVQAIVNAYSAIRNSADAVADNTAATLTGTQYTLVGVTGMTGVSAAGNALHLLDSVVDASPLAAVDTVPELQAMADAASHVIAGSAGGAAPSLLDFSALGISGVTTANLASVQTAIAATADDGTGVDSKGELQTVVTAAVSGGSSGQVTHVTSTLGGVTNLDVTSNLVLSADQTITVGSGFIHITDLGGAGYQGDTSVNTQDISVATAIAKNILTITGTGAETRIVINPLWDLDLSSKYQLSFDSGVFQDANHADVSVASINFSTVTPGTHSAGTAATEAHASQMMVNGTGALVAGKSWLDIQGIGNATGAVTQLGDLSGGSYALVMKNYATTRGGDPKLGGDGSDGIATRDTNIGVTNFGNNDIVYFDSQINDAGTQSFDSRYTTMTDGGSKGGLPGQNALLIGVVTTPQQNAGTSNILLGLEGNAGNQIYPSVVSIPGSVGWTDIWHTSGPAVVMG